MCSKYLKIALFKCCIRVYTERVYLTEFCGVYLRRFAGDALSPVKKLKLSSKKKKVPSTEACVEFIAPGHDTVFVER